MTTDAPRNIVFILADQLRSDVLGCYGGEAVDTPNIDRLGHEGRVFTQAVSSSPLCVPARTSLLTGLSSTSNGVIDNLRFLRPDYRDVGIRTWPELVAENGYRTVSVGKMHFYPWDISLGFEDRVVCEDKTWPKVDDDFAARLAEHGLAKSTSLSLPTTGHRLALVNPNERHLTPDGFVGDEAARMIREHDFARPLAMMVGFPGPHDPYDPRRDSLDLVDQDGVLPAIPGPAGIEALQTAKKQVYRRTAELGHVDYSELDEESVRVVRTHYAALVAEIDQEVGRILEALDAVGAKDNTLIVFASDHGDQLGDHGLSIGKRTFFQPSIQVPLLMCGPGIDPGVDDRLVDLRDVTATILAATGTDIPSWMDSHDLTAPDATRPHIVGALSDGAMITDGRWKLHVYSTGEVLLHDLATDPDEQSDLAGDPEFAVTLNKLYSQMTRTLISDLQSSVTDRRAAGTILDMVADGQGFGQRGWRRPWPNPLS